MVKKMALSLIGLLSVIFIYGQPNFAPIGAEWCYKGWTIDCTSKYIKLKVDQDTIINEKYCTVIDLYIEDVKIVDSEIYVNDQNGKITFYQDDKFNLLFDFSSTVMVGDTIEYYLPKNVSLYDISSTNNEISFVNPNYIVVESINTIQAQDYQLKKFNYNPYIKFNTEISCNELLIGIERIGVINSLFRRSCVQLLGGCIEEFIYYKDDEISFGDLESSCEGSNHTKDILINEVKVYPNPSSEKFVIDTDSFDIDNVIVYDNMMRKVMITKDSSINIMHLKTGI